MSKKIIFSTKPLKNHDHIIDQWVEGKKINDKFATEKEVRFTVVIPETLYCNLKIKTVQEKTKLKDLIKKIISDYIKTK